MTSDEGCIDPENSPQRTNVKARLRSRHNLIRSDSGCVNTSHQRWPVNTWRRVKIPKAATSVERTRQRLYKSSRKFRSELWSRSRGSPQSSPARHAAGYRPYHTHTWIFIYLAPMRVITTLRPGTMRKWHGMLTSRKERRKHQRMGL